MYNEAPATTKSFFSRNDSISPSKKPVCTNLSRGGLDHPARSLTDGYLIESALK